MATSQFQGIKPAMLEYFMGIAFNNHREYFLSTRKEYEENVKKPLQALADELVPTVLKIEPEIEQRPSRIVSRIRRDTRFTKDKSPYRDHMWLSFFPMGKAQSECFTMYYSISITSSSYGAGFYNNSPARARWMREKLLRQQEDFLRVLGDDEFAQRFEVLGDDYKRMEIPENLDPRLHALYCKKGFFVQHMDEITAKIEQPEYAQEIASGLSALEPLYRLMTQD